MKDTCSKEDCNNVVKGVGLCSTHYESRKLIDDDRLDGLAYQWYASRKPCISCEHAGVWHRPARRFDLCDWKGCHCRKFQDEVREYATALGERNGRSRLTWDEVREIRRLYKTENYSYGQLAQDFQVGKSTISKIVRGELWKESK